MKYVDDAGKGTSGSLGSAQDGAQDRTSDVRPALVSYQFRHFPQLDGFRGLAVVFVVFGHALENAALGPTFYAVGEAFASTGVFLFFVLSGFLITGILQREKSEKGKISLKRFYIRRVLRLGPALLAFLLAIVVLRQLGAITDLKTYEIVACLVYARNFFGKSSVLVHIWSLSLEEQFYLCWPGIFAALKEKRAFLVTVIVTTSFVIWRGFAIYQRLFDYGRGIYYVRPYFRFDSILIGACLATGFANNVRFLERARAVTKLVPAGALWIALAFWSYYGEALSRPLYLTLQMLLIAAILGQLALGQSRASQWFFGNALLRYLGKISYALYLWQQIFLMVKTPSWGVLRQFPVNVGISVLLAMVSYHVLEAPALRLKEHFE